MMFALTDRSWSIETSEFTARMRDYNWEVTFADRRLFELNPEFNYGGNAYYIVYRLCRKMGWKATALPPLKKDAMG